MFLTVFVFLTAFVLLMSVQGAEVNSFKKLSTCISDTDCQDGSSCIDNICKICVKCSLIFRKGNKCESDFNDCGDCLEGYKEISLTDNSAVKKPCKPIKKRQNLKECSTDDDCPPNDYCSEKSCVSCFDCSLINRIKPEKCARYPKDCGPCFIGYLSVHDKSRANYNKCERVRPDRVPHDISSASVSLALGLAFVVFSLVIFFIKNHKGSKSSETTFIPAVPSAPPFNLMYETHSTVKYVTEKTNPDTGYVRQELQKAKVFKLPSASYYPQDNVRSNEISVPDSGQNETSDVSDQTTSAQGEETIVSHMTAIFGECARSRSLSQVDSVNSDSNSQEEQPDVNVLNNDSAENSSHLVTENPAQVPEDSAKEPTEDLPLGQG